MAARQVSVVTNTLVDRLDSQPAGNIQHSPSKHSACLASMRALRSASATLIAIVAVWQPPLSRNISPRTRNRMHGWNSKPWPLLGVAAWPLRAYRVEDWRMEVLGTSATADHALT
jgi:hypothetical protein